jgi:hypothetical protein
MQKRAPQAGPPQKLRGFLLLSEAGQVGVVRKARIGIRSSELQQGNEAGRGGYCCCVVVGNVLNVLSVLTVNDRELRVSLVHCTRRPACVRARRPRTAPHHGSNAFRSLISHLLFHSSRSLLARPHLRSLALSTDTDTDHSTPTAPLSRASGSVYRSFHSPFVLLSLLSIPSPPSHPQSNLSDLSDALYAGRTSKITFWHRTTSVGYELELLS